MGLRDRAEAEVAEDQQRRETLAAEEEQRAERRHSELAKPAARWLAEWSGERVNAKMLIETVYPGITGSHYTWAVTLDGFNLLLKDSGPAPNSDVSRVFELLLVKDDGELVRIERPADLLGNEPEPATEPEVHRPRPPARALKGVWVVYAEELGIDVQGKSKQEIIDACVGDA